MSIEDSRSIDDSRRKFLQTAGMGIGWLAALDLFERTGVAAAANPLAPKQPPLPATAKSDRRITPSSRLAGAGSRKASSDIMRQP